MSRQWMTDPSWFQRYALAAAKLKTASSPTASQVRRLRDAARVTFKRVYSAVAFDIDGTLTPTGAASIDPEMATVVARLLQRGVPVALITGRGRGSSRAAVREIQELTSLSNWYFRRLSCITHNGVFLLHTSTSDPTADLSLEEPIAPGLKNPDALVTTIENAVRTCGLKLSDCEISREPRSLRASFASPELRARVLRTLRSLLAGGAYSGLFISEGSYANTPCLDLAATNKLTALAHYSKDLGVPPDRVLRIGDQGHKGGNDYDLLNSSSAFTVRRYSPNIGKCNLVLSPTLTHQLQGAAATTQVLNLVLLFPPISMDSHALRLHTPAFRRFEQLALARSRHENSDMADRLRLRLRSLLLPSGPDAISTVHISDIYDCSSGAVRFREWEFSPFPDSHPFLGLMDIPQLLALSNTPPRSRRSMYTDTGIVLRGPEYYVDLSRPRTSIRLSQYLLETLHFLSRAGQSLRHLGGETPDIPRVKAVYAIQDNVRDAILRVTYALYTHEAASTRPRFTLTRLLYSTALVPHTRAQFDLHFDSHHDWRTSVLRYLRTCGVVSRCLARVRRAIGTTLDDGDFSRDVFKWRECDGFLQNVTAVQLGLYELANTPELRNTKTLTVAGIPYGGLELPAIAAIVGAKRGIQVTPALLRVSHYGDSRTGARLRQGRRDYVDTVLSENAGLCIISGAERRAYAQPCILVDDNCTTGITLQLARNLLSARGFDVVGAIIVRFPGTNRLVHMSIPRHGFPDPDILFAFIRGLVAPSPYTRLLVPRKGKRMYEDQTDSFDKAKHRVIRYLLKNSTAPEGAA